MYNTALRITGDETLAEDALQEAFMSAFQNLSSYRADASFGAWLKRIVINKTLNLVQKAKKDSMLIADAEEEVGLDQMTQQEPRYTVDQIKEAMDILSPGYRTVLSLYLFEGYDHQEISEILGITTSTSKSQYMRAKDRLRSILIKKINYG